MEDRFHRSFDQRERGAAHLQKHIAPAARELMLPLENDVRATPVAISEPIMRPWDRLDPVRASFTVSNGKEQHVTDDDHEGHDEIDEAVEELNDTFEEAGDIAQGKKKVHLLRRLWQSTKEVAKEWFSFSWDQFKKNGLKYLGKWALNVAVGLGVLAGLAFVGLPVAVIVSAGVGLITAALELVAPVAIASSAIPILNAVAFMIVRSPAVLGKFVRIPEGLGAVLAIGAGATVGLPWWMAAAGGVLMVNFVRGGRQTFSGHRWHKKKEKRATV